LCLDTFQSAGGEWADPRTSSGRVEKDDVDSAWQKSLRDLAASVPPEKIFLLQISDAYKMETPFKDEVDESGTRPRGQWSHDYRPLPYDGGYLPVEDFTRAVLNTGFRGSFSMEVFDGKAPEKYPDDMSPYAQKAMIAMKKLLQNCETTKEVADVV
jgi:sugar phosphate isomerase/epimerase